MHGIQKYGGSGEVQPTAAVDAKTLEAATVFLRQVERMGGGRTVVSVPVRDPETVVSGRPAPVPYADPARPLNGAQPGPGDLSGPVYADRLYVRAEMWFAFWLGVGVTGAVGGMVTVFAPGPGALETMTAPAFVGSVISLAMANKVRDKHAEKRGARAMFGKGLRGVPITEAPDLRAVRR
jgi:hypothetical protein